ncbi:hypothetical protein ACFQ5N_09185 [Lutibacter holmesii]|uniref:YtxH domain-containing protein n=1 Tax=Lutibacter holmesii TaxID=1137985 RepID=A0ABW3WRU9_9FLAO
MDLKKDDSKLIIAGVAGGIAGLLLGAYIWRNDEKNAISKKLKTITKVIEQLENLDSEDAIVLKDKLKNLLLNLNYEESKE